MGKATIISHQGAGLYRAQLRLDRASIEAQKGRLTNNLALMELDTEAKKVALDDAHSALALAHTNLVAVQTDPNATSKDVEAAREEVERRQVDVSQAMSALSVAQAREDEARRRLETLASIPDDPEVYVWCADHTVDLSGDVGTIEIPGEGIDRVIIQPGYEGAAAYTPARDGIMSYRLGQSPEQAFFNAAILPGWQRHKPTYRVGRLDAKLIGGWGRVVLQDEASSAQGLNVNERAAGNVVSGPITYMSCHSAAFSVGDDVVVKFNDQDWDSPEIIGFVSNPKDCSAGRTLVVFQFNLKAESEVSAGSLSGNDGGLVCNPAWPGGAYAGSTGSTEAGCSLNIKDVLVGNTTSAVNQLLEEDALADVSGLTSVTTSAASELARIASSAAGQFGQSVGYSQRASDGDYCTSGGSVFMGTVPTKAQNENALRVSVSGLPSNSLAATLDAYQASLFGVYDLGGGNFNSLISEAIDNSPSWSFSGNLSLADLPDISGKSPIKFVRTLAGNFNTSVLGQKGGLVVVVEYQ